MIMKKINQLRYIKNLGQIWRLATSRVKSIEIAVNYICNKKCPGCYARNLRKEQKKIFINELDIKEIDKKYKAAHYNITGGEPLLNPYIYKILRAFPKSAIVSLVTNGDKLVFKRMDGTFTIDNIMLSNLSEAGLNTLQLSYGSNYNKYQNISIAKRAIKLGLNVCLSVTNIKKERDNILDAIDYAELYGFHVLFNLPGVGLEKVFDKETYLKYRNHPLVREDNMFWNGKDKCPAGIQKFYISADKSIYPCDRLHDKYSSYEEMRKEYKKKKKVHCRRYENDTFC